MESGPPPMPPPLPPNTETNVVSGYYENYKENQAELFRSESRRVRNSIITIGILYFASTMLGLAISNLINGQTVLYALLFPAVFTGLGFLGKIQPMLAVILASIVFVGLVILDIIIAGGIGAISGFIVKAIIIYLLIAGFQSAKTAETAKREMF